jgi:multicomponent Na+:H+ antiporter subunit C
MTSLTLFGFCGAALVGLGLYGILCHPGVLRKIIALNLLDSGVFLLFGVIARRGGGLLDGEAAVGADPVPQALVITGLVVAFAATALGVALVLRLAAASADADSERDKALDGAYPQATGPRASGATNQTRLGPTP